ncbi:MAG: quinate 5-dehydrogenase, partial [Firmicutes bacterium]|nr:quinate 5-dehydrogenase [Bacillota bacterium]
LEELRRLARRLLPELVKLPFHLLYPTGRKQEEGDPEKAAKFEPYYREADVIAGDFHLIRRYLPERLDGQVIITNTTTPEDVALLRARGAGYLVTTTPEFGGRTFGTNVLEAVFVALLDKPLPEISPTDYLALLRRLEFKPRILALAGEKKGHGQP